MLVVCLHHRKYFKRARASVITLQKHLRRHIQRRRFVKQRKAALVLQRHRRGQVARTRVRKLREEKKKKKEEEQKKEVEEEEKKKEPGKEEQAEASDGDAKKVGPFALCLFSITFKFSPFPIQNKASDLSSPPLIPTG